jgi:hypothetical protein
LYPQYFVCIQPEDIAISLTRPIDMPNGARTEPSAQPTMEAADIRRLSPLDTPAFLRLFQLRAAQIMWFLGAGASRSAGIKTAGDMIWDFKQRLYRSQKKLPPSAITDISEPAVQRKLQAYFDGLDRFPPAGSETEYSAYFEATYHAPRDRRAYLDELIARGKPSFGHHALALLMLEDLCRTIWTTNFDRTLEDATAERLGGTGRLVVADLKEPEKIRRAVDENRWPVYGKLHGDYHSDALKNTDAELRQQDAEMRRNLIDCCRRQGLAVIGYSGRDASIMAALEEALDEGRGFPGGLFWFKRGQDEPYSAVTSLIARARALGIDAHLVEADSFDELFSDLLRFLPQTADKLASLARSARPRLATAKPRPSTGPVPAIRMNALAVTSRPALCRIVECTIGGDKEVDEAIAKAGVDIIAHRVRDGVLAFGRDGDVRAAFEPFGIKAFDQHPLSSKKLVKEGGERALVRDALFRAIAGRPSLTIERRYSRVRLRPATDQVQTSIFNTDTVKPVDRVAGVVPKTDIPWSEACGLRVDYRLEQLWLLIEPTIATELPPGAPDDIVELTREFVRERRARRHNRFANALLDGWISLIVGSEQRVRLKAFGVADGIDAEFEILRTSAFSGIGKP